MSKRKPKGPLAEVADLQARLGLDGRGRFGITSMQALRARLTGADGQLVSLQFDRRAFSRLTDGAFDGSHPHLSNRRGAGAGGNDAQFDRLVGACDLAPEAAFQACTWGKKGVAGTEAEQLGFGSAFDLAAAIAADPAAEK